ncbi:type II secretion system F family protein [Actinophytocola sp.]|uniref:type II secretion system F family protein n=1 Tax=Actinophytocola sp. TaxID=1872138 RepID=UPI003899E88A
MVSLLLTSLALLCWPDTRAAARLRVIAGQGRNKHLRSPRRSAVPAVAAAVLTGWLAAGPGGATAGTLLALTVRRELRARAESRRVLTATDNLAEALRALVAGLRAGAHPAAAAELAAEDVHPETAATMRAIAAAARLDGDLTTVLGTASRPVLATALRRVVRAWQLAHRHGLPLADVLDAVRRDLDQRARFTRQVLARMAGPRSSAVVLSLLPVAGIALGVAVGADPLSVLAGTALGQVLLVTGVTLLCGGVAWSARITNQAVTG